MTGRVLGVDVRLDVAVYAETGYDLNLRPRLWQQRCNLALAGAPPMLLLLQARETEDDV